MASGASRLNQLLGLARDTSPDARATLMRALADLLLMQEGRFSAAEMQHIDAIMTYIAGQAPPPLRREIAERLAPAPGAPRALVNLLARDEISVAEAILRRSKALSEDDLVTIIRDQSQPHLKVIARRSEIAPTISDALVECGNEDVLVLLARNQGAQFSAGAMRALAAKARKLPELQAPITARYDLPPQILTQMYFHVSSALKKEILKRSDLIDPSLVEEAVTANRHNILNEAMDQEGAGASREARRFIAEQIAADRVNERLLKILLAENRQTEFVFAFAHLIGVDLATAKTILGDKTCEPLAIACRAADLDLQTFAKIVFTSRKDAGDDAKALRILDVYIKVPAESAERIMRFWRMRTDAAIDAARVARLSGDEPLTLTKRADGW